MSWSLLAQRGHRIDSRGPASRNPGCNQRDRQQRDERQCRRPRVERLEPEKRGLQNPADEVGAWQSDQNPESDHPKRIAQHHPDHIAGSGAQCHAHSDFVGPASHGVGEYAAESDGRKRQRNQSEGAGDESQKPLGSKHPVNQRGLGVKFGQRNSRIHRGDSLANGFGETAGIH